MAVPVTMWLHESTGNQNDPDTINKLRGLLDGTKCPILAH